MDSAALFPAAQTGGVSVAALTHLQVASLRYFEPDGHFAVVLHQATGLELPKVLRAASSVGEGSSCVLAWRSPRETLMFCDDLQQFSDIERRLKSATDGCMVVQTGGLIVLDVRGEKTAHLLCRIGSQASIPALGEARTSRIAELPVVSLCLQPDSVWLVVERVYLSHVREWIERTLADFE